jgi:NADH-quinone oxidoreductase subunit L
MEHGVMHTSEHIDANMYNMGGLRKKMPRTFWTFLIGGFALSVSRCDGRLWSKDEIFQVRSTVDTCWVWCAAISALLTAFYTMRQLP